MEVQICELYRKELEDISKKIGLDVDCCVELSLEYGIKALQGYISIKDTIEFVHEETD